MRYCEMLKCFLARQLCPEPYPYPTFLIICDTKDQLSEPAYVWIQPYGFPQVDFFCMFYLQGICQQLILFI